MRPVEGLADLGRHRPGGQLHDHATAIDQLDFVFASDSIADKVTATALNGVGEWGPSDNCRIAIAIDLGPDPGEVTGG